MGKSKLENVEMEVDQNVQQSGDDVGNNSVVDGLQRTKVNQDEYDELCTLVNAIAHPLAPRKVAKKIYKLIKKASKEKKYLRQGLCDVQRALRRNETGIIILAGNVTPIDVYSHVPVLCEEQDIPYIFCPSREHLGLAAGHKRASILLLIRKHESYADLFQEVRELIMTTPPDV